MATWTPTDEYVQEDIDTHNEKIDSLNDSAPRPDVDITYSLYRFVGGVDQITGLVAASSNAEGSIWEKTEYGIDSDISDFEITADGSLISMDTFNSIEGGTTNAGMTPMMAKVKTYPQTDDSGIFRDVISKKTTNESLYSYASDGVLYPSSPLTVDDYITYELSNNEIASLKKQFDLANETDHAIGVDTSGIYEAQFSSYLDELAQELINHMGVLLEPVINFHKTKNKKITNKEISSLGESDTSLASVSVDAFTEVDVEYTS